MLRSINSLEGYTILAQDGEVGTVKDLYFDDLTWEMQYVVVDTGGWLEDRRVLIPRPVLGQPDWAAKTFPVNMTKHSVENCPPIGAHEPVSRQKEAELHKYLDIEAYWMRLPGGAHPVAVSPPAPPEDEEEKAQPSRDPNLRSCKEVTGYHIQGRDDDVGHVEDFLVDDDTWLIPYLVVDTRNWLPGRKVLIAVNWLSSVRWADASVHVDLTREEIKNSPEYNPSEPVTSEYIERLKEHYGGVARWMQ
jgi:hypothetical protein